MTEGPWGPLGPVGRWKVGAVEIIAVLETDHTFSPDFLRTLLPEATREAVRAIDWLAPRWADTAGDLRFWTQTFVVRSEGKTILVDTCLGNDKERKNPAYHRLQTPFLDRLAVIGVQPEDVDFVVCTHLHFDHVGWNTRLCEGRWVPTFPRARHLVARAEWNHFVPRPGHAYVVEDSLRPISEAGLVDLVDLVDTGPFGAFEVGVDGTGRGTSGGGHALTNEVAIVATVGHTPGHCSVHITSRGEHALITGDLIHHPCQVAHADWTSPADSDRERARATRITVLRWAEDNRVLLIGSHFAAPAAGRVEGLRFFGEDPT